MVFTERMTPTSRRRVERACWAICIAVFFLGALGFRTLRRVEAAFRFPVAETRAGRAFEWPDSEPPTQGMASVFYAPVLAPGLADPGPASGRFRLAGTFLPWTQDTAEGRSRKAILDDMEDRRQHLVSEGDHVGDLRVLRIRADRVRVSVGGRDEDLVLAFTHRPVPLSRVPPEADPSGDSASEEAVGEPTRFGRRMGENRWVLERHALMDYYHELLDDPIRIAHLYRSFDPVMNETGHIDGYGLRIRGEEDFLGDVGLREGDHIRSVNSLPMTSQSRAEYFLGEFVRNDLGVVVLDIERDGTLRKLIYMIR